MGPSFHDQPWMWNQGYCVELSLQGTAVWNLGGALFPPLCETDLLVQDRSNFPARVEVPYDPAIGLFITPNPSCNIVQKPSKYLLSE